MKFNAADIRESGQYGMPIRHINAFANAACLENVVIGVRPVNELAHFFLLAGYPTKPFVVKNKSAKKGIAAGLIPIDPKYGRESPDCYPKHIEKLKHAFAADRSLIPSDLILPIERIRELKNFFGDELLISDVSSQKNLIFNPQQYPAIKDSQTCLKVTCYKDDELIIVYALKDNLLSNQFRIVDENFQSIQVLSKKINANQKILPITADYDLKMICVPTVDHDPGGLDKTPFRTQGIYKHSFFSNQQLVKNSYVVANSFLPKEDPIGGNWSPRVKYMVDCINHHVAIIDHKRRRSQNNIKDFDLPKPPLIRQTSNDFNISKTSKCSSAHPGLHVVHHNQEFSNPFADDLKENLPALILLPRPMNFSSITQDQNAKTSNMILIETLEELIKVRDIIKSKGYHWPTHAKYSSHLKPFPDYITHKLQQTLNQKKILNSFYDESDDVSFLEMVNSSFGRSSHTAQTLKK